MIQASDDVHLTSIPGFTLNPLEAPIWIEFYGVVDFVPGDFEFEIESFAGTPGLTATVEMFNFTTGAFEEVGTFGEAFLDTNSTEVFDLTASIDDFISVDLEVLARVGWRQTGFVINFPWEVNVDLACWRGSTFIFK